MSSDQVHLHHEIQQIVKILLKYEFYNINELLTNSIRKSRWKSSVQRAVDNFWTEKLRETATWYPSLEHLNSKLYFHLDFLIEFVNNSLILENSYLSKIFLILMNQLLLSVDLLSSCLLASCFSIALSGHPNCLIQLLTSRKILTHQEQQ
jgi:hypothetical protein